MVKSLIMYDEEVYSYGLEMLLKRITPTIEIFTKTLGDDLTITENYDYIFVVGVKKTVYQALHKMMKDNAEKTVVIIDKPLKSDVDGLLKHNILSLIDKRYGKKELVTILELIIYGKRFYPTDLLINNKSGLTERQLDILKMSKDGLSNKQIAYDLGITESTVKAHFTHILRKLGCTNRIEAIAKIEELGLLN